MNIHIRALQQNDLDSISLFMEAYVSDNEEKEYFIKILLETITGINPDFSETYAVAEGEDKIVVGLLGYRNPYKKFDSFHQGTAIEINELFVDKKYVGKGIGKKFIEYMRHIALENDQQEILVRSASRFENTSWKFYEKIGFVKVGFLNEEGGGISNIYLLKV